MFLTHFGRLDSLEEAGRQLHESLQFLTGLYDDARARFKSAEDKAAPELKQSLEEEVRTRILDSWVDQLLSRGFPDASAIQERLGMDAALNAGGIVFAAQRSLKKG